MIIVLEIGFPADLRLESVDWNLIILQSNNDTNTNTIRI